MNTILIIEDDKNLNNGLSIALQSNYKIISAKSIEEGVENIDYADLILLDMNLPDGDGMEIIKYTRKKSSIPIIVLSAIDLEPYIISAIELGADDYITKPFPLGILQAKIKRAFENSSKELNSYIFGKFYFNFRENIYSVGEERVYFTPTESKILYYLIKSKGQIVTKELLFEYVWGLDEDLLDKNTVSVNISRIRTKLCPYKPIEAIFGAGNKWVY